MNVIRSPRLDLISMGPALLEALLKGDLTRASQIGGFQMPDDLAIGERTIQRRLQQIRADPAVQPWLLRAIVIRASRTMCGRIGFHSPPKPEDLRDVAADGVELGYAIAPSFRRQGFAKEAALALIKWAFETHGQRCFILSITPSNEASLAMARSLGFREIGSHIDPEDGIESYLERRIDRWPEEWKSATVSYG
ncbi:MAG: GNAT family N-acetyltransferase [Anaerolineae bacterium]|nr:GNAT family N-acetyltransferase [Anaerolineae bacterium]